MRFNTAISKLMVFVRDVGSPVPAAAARTLRAAALALRPAPGRGALAAARRHRLARPRAVAGGRPRAGWSPRPITLAVQVNGKRRDEITVAADADEETIRQAALGCEAVQRHLGGRVPRKLIIVPGRLVNVVG